MLRREYRDRRLGNATVATGVSRVVALVHLAVNGRRILGKRDYPYDSISQRFGTPGRHGPLDARIFYFVDVVQVLGCDRRTLT